MKKKIISIVFSIFFVNFGIIYAQDHSEHKKSMMDHHKKTLKESAVNVGNKICPFSGESIEGMGGAAQVEHDGKKYNLCCQGCISMFNKNPQKYIDKIKEFDLEAYQFGFLPESITVNKGDIVILNLSSRDVNHGIYIADYNVNNMVKKDEPQLIEFVAEKSGEFDILCSVYCGKGHHDMKAKLIVK